MSWFEAKLSASLLFRTTYRSTLMRRSFVACLMALTRSGSSRLSLSWEILGIARPVLSQRKKTSDKNDGLKRKNTVTRDRVDKYAVIVQFSSPVLRWPEVDGDAFGSGVNSVHVPINARRRLTLL